MKAYTVTHAGEVESATWCADDDLTCAEIIDAARRVLRLSDRSIYRELADMLYRRWRGATEDGHGLIRAHIAAILAIHRGMGWDDDKIDYTRHALVQGDLECRDYLERLIPRWERRARR